MNPLSADRFAEFYEAVHGFPPFPWQKRLAAQVCGGKWPKAIALPTAAGKTACIDVAVFALARRAKDAPRRVFFTVDRRIVVDQAKTHADELACVLDRADAGVLLEIADQLRDLAEPGWLTLPAADRLCILRKRWDILDEKDIKKRGKIIKELPADERKWWNIRPLDVYALRGGMYRETAWARSPLQPTVIASTVDQVGSRLLFRGYGVTDSMKPVHAGLVGNDALILLDEAHCAKPFQQTADAVRHYRGWNDTTPAPFTFVTITATPTTTEDLFKIEAEDLENEVLAARITAKKPATLVVAKKGKLLDVLKEQAEALMGVDLGETKDKDGAVTKHTVQAVGVIVNRVKTARELAAQLRQQAKVKKGEVAPPPRKVILLTGRMRPMDRDAVLKQLEPLFSGTKTKLEGPVFVVATQCLEVGADLDFYALVTECASLDSLRQRFGRLNRVAARPSAKAVVVCREEYKEPKEKEKEQDPIYGNSLPNTWKFLTGEDGLRTEFDFGVSAMDAAIEGVDLTPMNAPTENAPVLFPAHIDCWVQTNPVPTPDPDVALFLHGLKQPGQPDVQVVFRSDLGKKPDQWAEIVALCPPSSSEAVAVPISLFKKWLAGDTIDDNTGDVEGGAAEEEDPTPNEPRTALRWLGEDSEQTGPITETKDVWPTKTYIVPCDAGAVKSLGDFVTENDTDPPADYAEEAFQRSRDKALLRLTADVIARWPTAFKVETLARFASVKEFPEDRQEFEDELDELCELLGTVKLLSADLEPWRWLPKAAASLVRPVEDRRRTRSRHRTIELHPDGGIVVVGKMRLHQFDPTYLDDSEPGASFKGEPVTLVDHSRGVAGYAVKFATGCGLSETLYEQAGLLHDLGKLDPRFQAMLKQGSPRTAVGTPLAKSARSPRTMRDRDEARQVHRYPSGARHELLSAAIVGRVTGDDDLLHLIATHHGSARPFADAVEENDAARKFSLDLFGVKVEKQSARQSIAEWNAELPERFWRVVRTHGWWGSAYREAVFRLADHAQSRAEQEGDAEARTDTLPEAKPPVKLPTPPSFALALPGLDGSNPLAFLAALGTLLVCERLAQAADAPAWLRGRVALSWGHEGSRHTPVLHLSGPAPSSEVFASLLAERMPKVIEQHPAAWVVEMLELGNGKGAVRDFAPLGRRGQTGVRQDRNRLDWITALSCESLLDADSPLQTVRCDYLLGNLRSVLNRTGEQHLSRSLFAQWDYADSLDNQSLHWEPTEDRRHAYQWHMPSGDPTRKKRGGMLGANRMALEAWPLFPCIPNGSKIATRGIFGTGMFDTFWTWPLWSSALTLQTIGSLLSLPDLQVRDRPVDTAAVRGRGITVVFRSQRILVGKTPNFTQALSLT